MSYRVNQVTRRMLDVTFALVGLLLLWPLLVVGLIAIWLQDFKRPLYVAPRALGKNKTFNIVKLRSMVAGADSKGGSSTSSNDKRITWVGHIIRKTKVDELPQLWNVIRGEMSLVGPRPQVVSEVQSYTAEELRLFNLCPGITDLASIVFADEGDILKGKPNPDLAYNQLIRPWKSRLGLIYVDQSNVRLYFECIILTIVSALNRSMALSAVCRILQRLKASPEVIEVARRDKSLNPAPPPGADQVVQK